MRGVPSFPGRVALIGLIAFASVAVLPSTPAAAQSQCEFDVRPAPRLAYEPRGERCEGLYIELQSTPMNLRVVSLLRGGTLDALEADSTVSVLVVRVPADLVLGDSLRTRIRVVGQPKVAGVNWALDGWAEPNSAFRWNLDEVFRRTGIPLSQVGLAGRTLRVQGIKDPVYVPLEVTGQGRAGNAASDAIHFVFHLPAAAEARVCVVAGGPPACTGTERIQSGGYFDGYFQATLPPAPPGLTPVVVQWRASVGGQQGHDRLDVFLPPVAPPQP